jgi:hypothetical protein
MIFFYNDKIKNRVPFILLQIKKLWWRTLFSKSNQTGTLINNWDE